MVKFRRPKKDQLMAEIAGQDVKPLDFSSVSNIPFLKAATIVKDGKWRDDETYFDVKAIDGLWRDTDWWQAQIGMVQLAIIKLEERIEAGASLLVEHRIHKRDIPADTISSWLEREKERIEHFRAWENVCFNEMRLIELRKRVG